MMSTSVMSSTVKKLHTSTKSLVIILSLITFAFNAQAGPSKNYDSHWAWINDFGGGEFGYNWGTGSTANMTFWWDHPDNFKLYGNPAIIRGWHYGKNPTGDTLLPKRISSISTAKTYFNYASGGRNMAGDFAYDLFLRWDDLKSKPQTEVMIWAGHKSWPLGSRTGYSVLTTGGVTYDLWEGYNKGAGFYVFSFVPEGTVGISKSLPTSGSLNIDLKIFFDWLQSNRASGGYYSDKMYLDAIEAGLEVIRGSGWAWIQGYFDVQ